MKRIFSALAFAIPLALIGMVAPPALAEGTEQVRSEAEATVQVYKRGDKFIVALYRTDGSSALALVEPPKSSPGGSGKQASEPDLADLMKNGRVTYTVELAPGGTAAAQAIAVSKPELLRGTAGDGTSAGKPAKGSAFAELTRKQKSDLRAKINATVGALGTIGKGLGTGVAVGSAALTQ